MKKRNCNNRRKIRPIWLKTVIATAKIPPHLTKLKAGKINCFPIKMNLLICETNKNKTLFWFMRGAASHRYYSCKMFAYAIAITRLH